MSHQGCFGLEFERDYVSELNLSKLNSPFYSHSFSAYFPKKNLVILLPQCLVNDAPVNTLYAFRDGDWLQTGDADGALRIWDLRKRGSIDAAPDSPTPGQCFSSVANDMLHKPISHICMSPHPGLCHGR